jgi:DNA-binding transcriptional MerR regulator
MSGTVPTTAEVTTFTISELASEFEVTTRTIRFYEDQGMLAPARIGTRRVFSPRDRTRLRLILRGKRIGLSLVEIREIVDMYDGPPGEVGQLQRLLDRIELRTAELHSRRTEIDGMLEDLDAVAANARHRLADLEEGIPAAPE